MCNKEQTYNKRDAVNRVIIKELLDVPQNSGRRRRSTTQGQKGRTQEETTDLDNETIEKIRGSGNGIGTTFPSLGKGTERAKTKIEEEIRRRAAPEQPIQTCMITIDGRRALVKSWRDSEAFRFQLADPETGAVRMLSLTDREVNQLSERFGDLVGMANQQKVAFITERLPILLSGAL